VAECTWLGKLIYSSLQAFLPFAEDKQLVIAILLPVCLQQKGLAEARPSAIAFDEMQTGT
jgi:hypothetical protein